MCHIDHLTGIALGQRADRSKTWIGTRRPLLLSLEMVCIGNEHNHVDAGSRTCSIWPHSDEYRFPRVRRPCGGGVFKPGDEVTVLPSGFQSRIKGVHDIGGLLMMPTHRSVSTRMRSTSAGGRHDQSNNAREQPAD